MMPQDEIRTILAEDLRIGMLSEEEQNEVFMKLRALILEKIETTIWEMLSPAERGQFEALFAHGDEGAARDFAQKKIPNLAILIETIALDTLRQVKNRS